MPTIYFGAGFGPCPARATFSVFKQVQGSSFICKTEKAIYLA
jgi:hypothetical protein